MMREKEMQKKERFIFFTLVLFILSQCAGGADETSQPEAFGGQDLSLSGKSLISYQLSTSKHCFVFPEGFSMSIGGNNFSGNQAVAWLESRLIEFRGTSSIYYQAAVYVTGNAAFTESKSGRTVSIQQRIVEDGNSTVFYFDVSGEVFITADKREVKDPRLSELYKMADAASAVIEDKIIIQESAKVPEWTSELERKITEKAAKGITGKEPSAGTGFIERVIAREKAAKAGEPSTPRFRYPINIMAAGAATPKIESTQFADKTNAATIIGRFYIWQKQDESGRLLELQADSAVIFYSPEQLQTGSRQTGSQDILAKGPVKSIYLAGDVVMTEGIRTIRADEAYYDFDEKTAVIVNAELKDFDVKRGIPIYLRAAKLMGIAENKFVARDVVLTSSEFYKPQISASISEIFITDTTPVETAAGQPSDNSFDAQMKKVSLKADDTTFFYWPSLRSNLESPELPIRRLQLGNSNRWGTSLETEWYLSRLLGLQEAQGVKSTLQADYFSERGPGGGVEVDYTRENYYGRLLGYMIRDTGEDFLGRYETREHLEPENKLRGRLSWQHRHFLPYDWQLTTELNYLSDENFLESFYREEFNLYKQETYVHLKKSVDNQAFSLLGSWRINDFADYLEQTPSVEYHITGQSIFDDRFTLYNDSQVSRFRQRIGDDHTTIIDENPYTFMTNRTELGLPFSWLSLKMVPFIAGTFGYDDRSGFSRSLVDGSNTGEFGEDKLFLGEMGVRAYAQPFWKVYPNFKSNLWDVEGLRHIIQPGVMISHVEKGDDVLDEQVRDIMALSFAQRLQTKRGPADNKRTVDWMRLDTDFVWVGDSQDASDSEPGADRYLWAKPIVPMRVLSAPDIFNGDLSPSSLHRFELFGPRRNYFSADYIWRATDTLAVLGDMYVDMQSGSVQQANVGFSRLCWPNLSYYIGSRYLKRVEILEEEGTNAVTFAATYILDPRYTLVFSQQYDFDYGSNVRNDLTLIRKYHRLNYAFTVSIDESLDENAIMFSIWPEGIKEMAIGERRYMDIGPTSGY